MKATIKIPDTVKDMTIDHLPFFIAITELAPNLSEVDQAFFDKLSPTKASDLNAIFFNDKPGSFDVYTSETNKNILAEIVYSCAQYEASTIKPEITIGDVTYVFNSDFSKMPVSFWREIKRADFGEHPLDMVAFCYVEKGMVYNQVDDNKNILNPRRERGEAFRDVLNLADYLDLQGFFLESWNVLSPFLKETDSQDKTKSERKSESSNP